MRFIALVLLVFLTGCAPVFIHPIYTGQDLVADPSFEGAWVDQDKAIWQIKKSGDGYEVAVLHTDDSPNPAIFKVHLLRLKETEFLDAAPKSLPDLGIAGHLAARISIQGDELWVAPLSEDWLNKMVQAGLAPQSVTGEDHQIIVTAPTSDLQRFLLLHAANADAWEDGAATLRRVH